MNECSRIHYTKWARWVSEIAQPEGALTPWWAGPGGRSPSPPPATVGENGCVAERVCKSVRRCVGESVWKGRCVGLWICSKMCACNTGHKLLNLRMRVLNSRHRAGGGVHNYKSEFSVAPPIRFFWGLPWNIACLGKFTMGGAAIGVCGNGMY